MNSKIVYQFAVEIFLHKQPIYNIQMFISSGVLLLHVCHKKNGKYCIPLDEITLGK
jgi:hypothetical protein